MSKHIFTPNGNTPMFVNAGNGSLRFIFPVPERFTISNDDILPAELPRGQILF